jgi:hypothetical protein
MVVVNDVLIGSISSREDRTKRHYGVSCRTTVDRFLVVKREDEDLCMSHHAACNHDVTLWDDASTVHLCCVVTAGRHMMRA